MSAIPRVTDWFTLPAAGRIPRVRLSPTSMVVLGLLARLGPLTSYEMKQMVALSVGQFWTFPHSQLYAEPQRLVAAGLVEVEVEQGGRQRRTYSITDEGRGALEAWIREGSDRPTEFRDLGLLKLFFVSEAGDQAIADLAHTRLEYHRSLMNMLERARDDLNQSPPNPPAEGRPLVTVEGEVVPEPTDTMRTVLEAGLTVHRAMADFWETVLRRAEV